MAGEAIVIHKTAKQAFDELGLKKIQQVQSYIDAGMTITSRADVEKALKSVGFYS